MCLEASGCYTFALVFVYYSPGLLIPYWRCHHENQRELQLLLSVLELGSQAHRFPSGVSHIVFI